MTTTLTGSEFKVSDALKVIFKDEHGRPFRFTNPPRVFITGYWKNSVNPVEFSDTVTEISESFFVVRGKNMGEDYYIQWLAIG